MLIFRFGMPSQNAASPRNGEGSGSCGLGVILAAKDIMSIGAGAINQFKWSFLNSSSLRKSLMLKILEWDV